MRLVYLSPVPWSSFAQRPQKFVEWFNLRTGGQVLWIDPYPTRLPQLADFKRSGTSSPGEAQEHYPWLQLLRPRSLPIEPLPLIGRTNHLFWESIKKRVRDFIQGDDALIVAGKPSLLAISLINHFDSIPSVYDAMDEFPAFYKGLSSFSMAARERELANTVDYLWVTSSRLKERWGEYRDDVRFIPNGLDTRFFANIHSKPLSTGPKIFGYVGTIATWFDWKWIIALANARQDDIVQLIGPNFHPTSLPLPRNIQLLPACAHDEAMQAMRRFDVGLIPFLRNPLTASVDPIKFYEYRASGLPVISTAFGEMNFRRHEQGTYISESLDDIAELAGNALAHSDTSAFSTQFIHDHSWHARFDSTGILTQHGALATP
ncbi:glycosyl transferase [Pseudomonas putida]|uniref:glycosyl transferase n=1 Tax=Pseudomonas putida TaxID=303 RepID=UPI003905CD7F